MVLSDLYIQPLKQRADKHLSVDVVCGIAGQVNYMPG
jgi:hypothetical protein